MVIERVVERGLDVNDAVQDVLLDFFFFLRLASLAGGPSSAPPASWRLVGALGRLGPLGLLCFSAFSGFSAIRFSHSPYFPAGAIAAGLRTMPRFGPLRVRALVWVRWPRTGRPLRWRRPR